MVRTMTFKIILLVSVVVSNAQVMNRLLPMVANAEREYLNRLMKNDIVQRAARASTALLTDSIDAISLTPTTIAQAIGVGSELPILINDRNVAEFSNRILHEFQIGLENEDTLLSFESLVAKNGFTVQKHSVVTDDGYILTMFRIPATGPVVFLMHGLISSSDDYVLAGPDNGLAYLLAREGYDVWLGNARGNKHSRHHITLNPSDAAFWDFSWHEIGYYDLPAMIDYVLAATGKESLYYIGHSQGTTSFFVMASERPEYNSKIALMAALSPVVFMSRAKSPVLRLFSPASPLIHTVLKTFGVYEFMPDNVVTKALNRFMCGIGPLAEILCSNMIMTVAGFSFDQMNMTNLPVIFSHSPAGSSVKQFVHYGQGVVTGDFRKFDYGSRKNLERYGSETPPRYQLGNIVAPVVLFHSRADWLAHPDDVNELEQKLGNVLHSIDVPFHPFNHVDFLWAKDFKTLIYEQLRPYLLSI